MDFTSDSILRIVTDTTLTHQQAMMNLADLAVSHPQAIEVPDGYVDWEKAGVLCDMGEPRLLYAPRYILPDYEKLMIDGCEFLRLPRPATLADAIQTLEIFYLHVPSVTHLPVYLGNIDILLEPFVLGEDQADARAQIRRFLDFISRTLPNSFSHANIGPVETVTGRLIVEIEAERQDAVPGLTLLYDRELTSRSFAEDCVRSAFACAKPSFANHRVYRSEHAQPYGIASCYNALSIGGGAFTLSRIVLKRAADAASGIEDFLTRVLPQATDALCHFMDRKIEFLVERSHFFSSSFLVKEGFVAKDAFTGMLGVVGLHEAVNILLEKEGNPARFGKDSEADTLGHTIMRHLEQLVQAHQNRYCTVSGGHFVLHAQVGIDSDIGISPGARIAIGEELPLYQHLRHAGSFHPYFPSGTGDIFPFDETYAREPLAILDIIDGGFASGMRYFSTYGKDSDVIRITGYLVKKSDMDALARGETVLQNNVIWGLGEARHGKILERKVRG